MNKFVSVFLISFCFFNLAFARETTFNINLYSGVKNATEVTKLQIFLSNQKLFNIQPTGKYLSMTTEAVKVFQKNNNLIVTGNFNKATREVANKLLVVSGLNQNISNNIPKATISNVQVSSPKAMSALIIGTTERVVYWDKKGYPLDVGVTINLLKKVSDQPSSFQVLRVIKESTQNDGQESWYSKAGEYSKDIYVEVVCLSSHQFNQGCEGATPVPLNQ